MRTVPSYARQTEVWADLLSMLGFKQIIFIHSSDQEGRAMLGKFQSKTESENRKVGQLLIYYCVYSCSFVTILGDHLQMASDLIH